MHNSGNSSIQIDRFDDHQFHEVDLVNISRLGRQWFGESFDFKSEQEFTTFQISILTPLKSVQHWLQRHSLN
jgi:hypothetical protein